MLDRASDGPVEVKCPGVGTWFYRNYVVYEQEFINSILTGSSVPVKQHGQTVAWATPPQFEPYLEHRGFVRHNGRMWRFPQLNPEAGKLEI